MRDKTVRLHHKTFRQFCESIALNGFLDGDRNAEFGFPSGVYLSPPGMVWSCGTPVEFDPADGPGVDGPEEVVFAFDIPDHIAEPFAVWEDGDPHPDSGEMTPPILYEYLVPAEIANRYCIGPVAWQGEPPLTPELLALIHGRRHGG